MLVEKQRYDLSIDPRLRLNPNEEDMTFATSPLHTNTALRNIKAAQQRTALVDHRKMGGRKSLSIFECVLVTCSSHKLRKDLILA